MLKRKTIILLSLTLSLFCISCGATTSITKTEDINKASYNKTESSTKTKDIYKNLDSSKTKSSAKVKDTFKSPFSSKTKSGSKSIDVIQAPYIGMPISSINDTLLGKPTKTDLSDASSPRYYWYFNECSFYARGTAINEYTHKTDYDNIHLCEAYGTINEKEEVQHKAYIETADVTTIPFCSPNINDFTSFDKLKKYYNKMTKKSGILDVSPQVTDYWAKARKWFKYYNEHVEDVY